MSARPYSILIVSGDRTLLRRTSRFLEIFGFEVRQASTEASTLAAAEAHAPDFLLVDGGLLTQGGDQLKKQLCRQIRRLPSHVFTYCLLLVENIEVAALTEALEAGFDDFLARDLVYGELLARLRAGARVLEYERRLAEQSGVDSITGLAERNAWLREWPKWRAACEADKAKHALPYLAVLDFDSFGRIARVQGLIAYRDVLRSAAQCIERALPTSAIAGVLHDNRLGILFSAANDEAAEKLAESWLQSLRSSSLKVNQAEVRVTASIGFTGLLANEPSDIALQRAAGALQLAKTSGRNCVVHSDEVADEQQTWTEIAAEGKLFATTMARDVMLPCPLLVGADESVDQGLALAEQTQLDTLPVVDVEGRLLGLVTLASLQAARSQGSRSRQASVRLVKHVMQTDFARFNETTPLGEMMEHFTESDQDMAVVVRDRCPVGLISCQGLAALNDRLDVAAFQPASAREGSEFLLVPEIFSSDTN
jgi:two-component system, cell cycle response regulator